MLILALMTAIGATLTLPGIAGFVLTIGMAVDANVLIYERIREELRTGKTRDLGDRRGLHARFRHHRRQPAHDARRRSHHVLAGVRPDPRLRGHAVARHSDVDFLRSHDYAPLGRHVAEECQDEIQIPPSARLS